MLTWLRFLGRLANGWLPGLLAVLLVLAAVGIASAETYVVKPGDTLYEIGLKFAVDPDEIAAANNIRNPQGLQIGQALTIPGGSGSGATALGQQTYVIEEGDTLSEIAERYGTTVAALVGLNGIRDSSLVRVGQELVVPGQAGSRLTPASSESAFYTVIFGDTLGAIADMFGVSAHSIASASGLSDPDRLREGQRLVIPGRADLSARGGRRFAFVWPAFGEITGYFHERGPWWVRGYHEGLDIGAPYGSIVRAAEQGMVIEAEYGWNRGYGTYIKIDHGNGLHTLYSHLSELHVREWEEVDRGQVIGLIGSTGASTGPHLHFEVRVDGEKRDPLGYLP